MQDIQAERQMIKAAHEIATAGHAGQKRKDGKPYITHPEAVADIVDQEFHSLMPNSEAARNIWSPLKSYVIAAALLHDVIEDTFITSEYLRNAGMPVMVVEMVYMVTKRPGETYFDFIMRLHDSGHVGAKIVKLADLRHNMSDLKEGAMKDKYRFAEYLLSYFNN
jgi:(p)ppGpp synthase/HD superfamily hydrolase